MNNLQLLAKDIQILEDFISHSALRTVTFKNYRKDLDAKII